MKKVFFIVFAFLIILIIILFLIFPSNTKNISTPTEFVSTPTPIYVPVNTPTPVVPTPTPVDTTSPTLSISGVTVNNFFKTAQPIDTKGDVKIAGTSSTYQVTYLPHFNEFLITVLSAPFNTVRQQAENAFTTSLGISNDQACKLNVFVATPIRINPNESGTNYPLSFCEQVSPTTTTP